MDITIVAGQIAMMLAIVAVGLWLRLRGVFTDSVIKGVNTLVLNVAWPMLAIMTTQKDYTPETLTGFFSVLTASFVAQAAAFLAVRAIWRKRGDGRLGGPAFWSLCSFPNAGFMGLPIAQAVYGDTGVLYLAAYVIGFNLVLWTFGVFSYTGFRLKSMKGLLSPGFIAAILGTIMFVARIKLPTVPMAVVNQIGALNTPLSLLLLGSRMDTLRIKGLIDKRLAITSACKLVIMPLVAAFAMKAAGMSGMTLGISVILTAMPSAAACQMLAERYDGEIAFAAKGVSVNTVLSLMTIPLVLMIAGV